MTTQGFKRKLSAIFSADVAGYSRLMGEDEAATVRTLEAYKEIMFSLIKQHRGRVIDSPGDNLLAEFASVVDAVQCAVAVQKELQARNADLPETRRMRFRIGINLGDVIEEGDRIYGDGVNIAARLESCADPGGICISKTAFDQIETKLPLGYEFLGEQEVKNIARPVGAYRVLMDPRVTVAGAKEKKPSIPLWRRKGVLFGVAAVLVVVMGVAVWTFYWRGPRIEPASKEEMAYPLPDKPSIAVLPFDNMSGDTDQEYFSNGLVEEIITALSKVPQLFVIARNSTFSYKGKPVKVSQIAEELGVRYVLEGSVRKEGERVRITAQLIDALTGHHLWAERYDRRLEDIFSLQDEITMKILTALQLKLTEGEIARIGARGTRKLEAYLKVLQARGPFYTITKEGLAQARRLCEEAIEIDPDYAAAYVYLGSTHFMDVVMGSSKSPEQSLKLAFEAIMKAKTLDDSYAAAHSILGFIYVMKKQYDKAIAENKLAVALEPNSPDALIWMSLVLTFSGNHQEAVQPAERALRLDPLAPPWWFRALGQAYSWVGRYEESISAFKKSLQRAPDDITTHLSLTYTYSWAGRMKEAQAQAQEVLRINPKYCLEQDRRISLYKLQEDRERILDGLRKAGLPETPPLPLPDKPSIAVLPFVNMSDDKSQEFFSDGLTEEIITALSKAPQLFVIASNTSFTYKGKPVNVRKVSKELGVQYVIEGSVRRDGERVRVTAQMIDALKDHHIWAERYDKQFKDIFSVQDDITKKIITAVHVILTEGERARVFSRGTSNLQAYLKAVQAEWHVNQATKDSVLRAEKLAEEAIELDPNYAYAHMTLGSVQIYHLFLGISQSPHDTLMRALEEYKKAVALDPKSGEAHALLAYALVMARQYDKAEAECERAMVLAPNSYKSLYHCASALTFLGKREEAIDLFRDALRINPEPPNSLYRHFGVACRDSGRYDEAIKLSKKATERNPPDKS